MYRIKSNGRDQWAVVDAQERPRFAGSLRQCEDWLDFQENLRSCRAATLRPSWIQRLGEAVARWFRPSRSGIPSGSAAR